MHSGPPVNEYKAAEELGYLYLQRLTQPDPVSKRTSLSQLHASSGVLDLVECEFAMGQGLFEVEVETVPTL